MHSPPIDVGYRLTSRNLNTCLFQRTADLSWNITREMHVESKIANPPRDQVACLRNVECQKAVNGKAFLLRCYQRCGTAIGKDQERQYLLQLMSFLKMQ